MSSISLDLRGNLEHHPPPNDGSAGRLTLKALLRFLNCRANFEERVDELLLPSPVVCRFRRLEERCGHLSFKHVRTMFP